MTCKIYWTEMNWYQRGWTLFIDNEPLCDRFNGMLHQVRTIMNMLRLNESRARQWLIRNFNSLCKLSACYTLLPLYDVLEEYCLRISYIKEN